MDAQKPQSDTKPRFSFYEGCDGHYHKVGEIRDLIPQFKAFYYAERRREPGRSAIKIINDFNARIAPETFHPWEKQYRLWRKKWDAELLAAQGFEEEQRAVQTVIKTHDEQGIAVVPDERTLEAGAHTLAGELLNDALGILKRDQDAEEAYEDEIIVKRRNYVLNVFNYVMRAAHGKEALNLKSAAEKRQAAGFMIDLINRATAGNMTDEEMAMLRGSIASRSSTQDASPGAHLATPS